MKLRRKEKDVEQLKKDGDKHEKVFNAAMGNAFADAFAKAKQK